MGGKTDQIKVRIKEAAGVLTVSELLKREGNLDKVVGCEGKSGEGDE